MEDPAKYLKLAAYFRELAGEAEGEAAAEFRAVAEDYEKLAARAESESEGPST